MVQVIFDHVTSLQTITKIFEMSERDPTWSVCMRYALTLDKEADSSALWTFPAAQQFMDETKLM